MNIKQIITRSYFLIKSYLNILKIKILISKYEQKNYKSNDNKSSYYLELKRNGYLSLDFEVFFGDKLDQLISKKDLTENIVFDHTAHHKSFNVPTKFISKIINSEKLQLLLKLYINKDVRLDNVYLDVQKNNQNFNFSSGWHRDIVGKRIKMYICLDSDKNSSKTSIISNSKSFKLNNFILLAKRYFQIIGKLNSNQKKEEVVLNYKKDNFILFDTDLIHRGIYNGDSDAKRVCIVFEFIDRYKSNKIHKFAPCGPGERNKNFLIFESDEINSLKGSTLFDNSISKLNKDKIFYKIDNLHDEQN